MPKGRILELIRIAADTPTQSKGLLVKIEAEDSSIKYLSLNKGWEVEFELSETRLNKITKLTAVHEEKLYPHSG